MKLKPLSASILFIALLCFLNIAAMANQCQDQCNQSLQECTNSCGGGCLAECQYYYTQCAEAAINAFYPIYVQHFCFLPQYQNSPDCLDILAQLSAASLTCSYYYNMCSSTCETDPTYVSCIQGCSTSASQCLANCQ
jgi:hypothetical protein